VELAAHLGRPTDPFHELTDRGTGHRNQPCLYFSALITLRNWIPAWEQLTPLDAARRSNAVELVEWLRGRGAHSATELSAS
jgi:hypothetical protein